MRYEVDYEKLRLRDVVPCSLVDIYQRFGEIICLHLQRRRVELQYSSNLKIKAARSSETSAMMHPTTGLSHP
jgi:hypothetical protein